MLVSQTALLQQQSGNHTPHKDGLKNGLKSLGWEWFSLDYAGTKKGPCGPYFNELQTSLDVCKS
jgi:hypothetical protein